MPAELMTMSAIEQAAAVRAGEVSATELVGASLDEIDRLDGEINAVITRVDDRARAEAAAIGAGDERPLAGVSVVIKDLTQMTEGIRTTFGSAAAGEFIPPRPNSAHEVEESAPPWEGEQFVETFITVWTVELGGSVNGVGTLIGQPLADDQLELVTPTLAQPPFPLGTLAPDPGEPAMRLLWKSSTYVPFTPRSTLPASPRSRCRCTSRPMGSRSASSSSARPRARSSSSRSPASSSRRPRGRTAGPRRRPPAPSSSKRQCARLGGVV